MNDLKPCPFCGGEAEIERVGTSRQSSIVRCTNCACKLEANESTEWTGERWNARAAVKSPAFWIVATDSLPVDAPDEVLIVFGLNADGGGRITAARFTGGKFEVFGEAITVSHWMPASAVKRP